MNLFQITFKSKPNIQQIKTSPKWKYGVKPDWQKWRKNLPEIQPAGNVEIDYENFEENML